MSDRGLPIVDGAPACPFVAFEDDRDERAASPDHRHRCYAEIRPAPRALAHQEAYCLSSAFPVCPTFQDWARREAARARPGAASGAAAGAEPDAGPVSPPRNPPRDWTAPPPWLADGPAPGQGDDAIGAPDAPGFLADRADLPDRPDGDVRDDPAAPANRYEDRAEPADRAEPRGEGRGLAGSRADRLATGTGVPAGASVAPPAAPDPRDEVDEWADDDEADPPGRDEPAGRYGERRGGRPGIGSGDRRPRVGQTRRRDDAAPSWEQPRRYEAYPTIKTRVGMPALPRVGRLATMAGALLLAAVALFFLPQFLGIGEADRGSGAASPSPSAAAASPSAEPSPSVAPAPTPQVYVVKSGDTLSKIAARFGVSLDELIAANRETLPDPDKLAIGDSVIIPTPAGGDGETPADESAAP